VSQRGEVFSAKTLVEKYKIDGFQLPHSYSIVNCAVAWAFLSSKVPSHNSLKVKQS